MYERERERRARNEKIKMWRLFENYSRRKEEGEINNVSLLNVFPSYTVGGAAFSHLVSLQED